MKKPQIPDNEQERLQALISLDILDTDSEPAYDAITELAKVFFQVPIVAISLVESERQWFKSMQGLDVCETSREVSFCGHTILQEKVFVVENALTDDRFCDNPLVANEPNIRFYAGYPIKSPSGFNIGSLCIIDQEPRKFTAEKLNYLKKFVTIIEKELFEKRKSIGYLNEIAKIQRMHISNVTPQDLFNYILTFLLNHTSSEYGFIGAVLKDEETGAPYLKTYAISNIAWDDATRAFYKENAPEGMEFRNLKSLFGYTLKTGERIISNSPQLDPRSGGLPDGHPDLNCYLGMPIYGKDGFIAMYGLANRKGGYNDSVVDTLNAITQIMTSIIESTRGKAIIENMARRDALTGAYNRTYLREYVTNRISQQDVENKCAIIMIDFDNFKKVNDYYGHPVGDSLLKLFIKRINALVKGKAIVARIGGDEFIIFLEGFSNTSAASDLANQIIELSKHPYEINGHNIVCTVSVGIAFYPDSGRTYEELAKRVDLALYKAKKTKDHFVFYSESLGIKFKNKFDLENKIRSAIKNGGFYCVYQPQIDVETNQVLGVEALVRLDEELSPSVFIPVVEEVGLGEKLNRIVLSQIIDDISQLELVRPVKFSMNLAMKGERFKQHVLDLSRELLVAGVINQLGSFEFEVTENSLLFSEYSNKGELKELASLLKENKISLAIDDFGIKQSSINRLIESDFQTIKIDKCFVDGLTSVQHTESSAVIKAVLVLAKELNLTVIAEGIETADQLNLLKALGVQFVQGFFLSKPLNIQQLKGLLNAGNQ